MSFFTPKWSCLAILLALLVNFSVAGFYAMRPDGSQKNITYFWASITLFLAALSLYLFFFSSRIMALAPLFPMYMFIRLCILTCRNQADAKQQDRGEQQ